VGVKVDVANFFFCTSMKQLWALKWALWELGWGRLSGRGLFFRSISMGQSIGIWVNR